MLKILHAVRLQTSKVQEENGALQDVRLKFGRLMLSAHAFILLDQTHSSAMQGMTEHGQGRQKDE